MYMPVMDLNRDSTPIFLFRNAEEVFTYIVWAFTAIVVVFSTCLGVLDKSLVMSSSAILVVGTMALLAISIFFGLVVFFPRYFVYKGIASELGRVFSIPFNSYTQVIYDGIRWEMTSLAYALIDDLDLSKGMVLVLGDYVHGISSREDISCNPYQVEAGQIIITKSGLRLEILKVEPSSVCLRILAFRRMGIWFPAAA